MKYIAFQHSLPIIVNCIHQTRMHFSSGKVEQFHQIWWRVSTRTIRKLDIASIYRAACHLELGTRTAFSHPIRGMSVWQSIESGTRQPSWHNVLSLYAINHFHLVTSTLNVSRHYTSTTTKLVQFNPNLVAAIKRRKRFWYKWHDNYSI